MITADRKRAMQERGVKLVEAHRRSGRRASIKRDWMGFESRQPGAPVGRAVAADQETKTGRWCRGRDSISNWPNRLWNFDKHYQYIGGQGAGGMGYGAPAAVGGGAG